MKLKHLLLSHPTSSGRNHTGKVTLRHRGGGHKTLLRSLSSPSLLSPLFSSYDPSRNTPLLLSRDSSSNSFSFSLFPLPFSSQFPSSLLINPLSSLVSPLSTFSNTFPLSSFPIGSFVFNINSQYLRSHGSFAQILHIGPLFTFLFSNNSKFLILSSSFLATGILPFSFPPRKFHKAGDSRHLNRRPVVRGEAMSNNDHPNGGNTKNGRLPRNL